MLARVATRLLINEFEDVALVITPFVVNRLVEVALVITDDEAKRF
jgi:hypothetical protein